MPTASRGDQPASAVCVTSPPGLTDDGLEWFIPELGRGNRRGIRVGEHLPDDHPLVKGYPQHFTPSAEPPDAWPVSVLSAEALQRQRVEQQLLASRPARLVQPVCTRCGDAAETVLVEDQPSVLGKVNALAILEDSDWAARWKVELTFDTAVRVWQQQQAKLALVEGEFRRTHLTCPEGTAPVDEPVPVETRAMHWRLETIRSVG